MARNWWIRITKVQKWNLYKSLFSKFLKPPSPNRQSLHCTSKQLQIKLELVALLCSGLTYLLQSYFLSETKWENLTLSIHSSCLERPPRCNKDHAHRWVSREAYYGYLIFLSLENQGQGVTREWLLLLLPLPPQATHKKYFSGLLLNLGEVSLLRPFPGPRSKSDNCKSKGRYCCRKESRQKYGFLFWCAPRYNQLNDIVVWDDES